MKKLTELVQHEALLVVLSGDQMENVKGGNNLECWYI